MSDSMRAEQLVPKQRTHSIIREHILHIYLAASTRAEQLVTKNSHTSVPPRDAA
jgi:hypothetical protein